MLNAGLTGLAEIFFSVYTTYTIVCSLLQARQLDYSMALLMLITTHYCSFLVVVAQSRSHVKEKSSWLKRTHEMEEQEALSLLQKKKPSSRASQGGARDLTPQPSASFFLPSAGCRLYPEIEYFIIISDGSAHPDEVKVARRQVDDKYMKSLDQQAVSKSGREYSWSFQACSPGFGDHC